MTLRVLGGASGGLGGGTPPVLQSAFQVPLLAPWDTLKAHPHAPISAACFRTQSMQPLWGCAHRRRNAEMLHCLGTGHRIGGTGRGFSQLSTRCTLLPPPVSKVLSARLSAERNSHCAWYQYACALGKPARSNCPKLLITLGQPPLGSP